MECECGHMPWSHSTVTYPKYREPCDVCVECGRGKPGPGKECCLTPKRCSCRSFTRAETAGVA